MLSADLNDEQIAELVNDICSLADIDGDGSVNVDEFVQVTHASSLKLIRMLQISTIYSPVTPLSPTVPLGRFVRPHERDYELQEA